MSLRLRLVAAVGYILLLIIVALEVPLALNLARRVDAEVKNDAASQAFVVAAGASGRLDSAQNLQRLAEDAGEDLGARVIIVDRQGILRADSTGTDLIGQSYAEGDRPEIEAALNGSRSQGERHSDELNEDLLYTAVPVTDERGETVGAVRVTQSVDAVNERVRNSVLTLIGIGALALLLGLALASVLAETISRPLRRLAGTARAVEAGDLGARAEVEGPTEQQEVAHAFNDMTERLAVVLAAQREFVANASHQLRTPLTGLRLRLESAAMKADTSELEHELNAAEREVERLSRLLTALLTLAREGQAPTPGKSVSLDEAAASAHARWADRAAQDGSRLTLEGPVGVTACASEEDVAIVFDNLIENALHYAPGAAVALRWGNAGDEAWLAVEDEGPGIAPGEEATLFERFARGSAGTGSAGTGLGLAIVQMLARRWRGRASIRNRPEGGARVEVWLPVADAGDLPVANHRLDEALTGGS
jgi:two-component system, OmpR family, sensor kinase